MVRIKNARHDGPWGHAEKLDLEKRSSLIVAQGGFYEITLNLPRTSTFEHMTSDKQKELYASIWHDIKNTISINSDVDFVFEFCKSGHVHLHGIIRVPADFKLIPIGGISDIVKKFCIAYTKYHCVPCFEKTIKYNSSNLFYMDNVYKSPAICVRYRSRECHVRMIEWENYMNKCV